MSDLWAFLGDPQNRAVLGWLGGGLVVLAGGAWTVVKFLARGKGDDAEPAAPPSGTVEVLADRGGVAGGGNVSVRTSHGLSGLHAVLLVAAVAGAVLLAAGLLGGRITARDCGIAVGGGVKGSTLTADCPVPAGR
jgi:hypothetical protein